MVLYWLAFGGGGGGGDKGFQYPSQGYWSESEHYNAMGARTRLHRGCSPAL